VIEDSAKVLNVRDSTDNDKSLRFGCWVFVLSNPFDIYVERWACLLLAKCSRFDQFFKRGNIRKMRHFSHKKSCSDIVRLRGGKS
jgi:hypothetical protein